MYDFQKKQMSAEEIEAREYVAFYRFWAWEYTRRNSEFLGIIKSISEAETYFQEIGISDFSMSALGIADSDSIHFYQPYIQREFSEDELDMFKKAFWEKMKARYKFGFRFTGPRPNLEYSSSEILELLQNGGELARPGEPRERSEVARLISQRDIKNGIKYLSNGNHTILGYDALVAIDFDRPIEEIKSQIENVKEEFELYRKIENNEEGVHLNIKSVEIEKIGIQKNPNIRFKIGTDNSRAIGIWLWDYIQNSDEPTQRGVKIEAIRELKERFDMAKLGYAQTDTRTFQNFLDSTEKCIEGAEVFAMH